MGKEEDPLRNTYLTHSFRRAAPPLPDCYLLSLSLSPPVITSLIFPSSFSFLQSLPPACASASPLSYVPSLLTSSHLEEHTRVVGFKMSYFSRCLSVCLSAWLCVCRLLRRREKEGRKEMKEGEEEEETQRESFLFHFHSFFLLSFPFNSSFIYSFISLLPSSFLFPSILPSSFSFPLILNFFFLRHLN